MTYDYSTGGITRDFHVKKAENTCKSNTGKTTLIGIMCRTCPHYGGDLQFFDEDYEKQFYVKCKYHREDDQGCEVVLRKMYEAFENEALNNYE